MFSHRQNRGLNSQAEACIWACAWRKLKPEEDHVGKEKILKREDHKRLRIRGLVWYESGNKLLYFASCCDDQSLIKASWTGKGLTLGLRKLGQEPGGRKWNRAQMNTMLWLVYSHLLRYPSNTMQAHQPRAGTTHSGLDPPTSIRNQENASQVNLMDPHSSIDVHSSQMTQFPSSWPNYST